MKTAILIAVACTALAGCATKQYAQVGYLTDYEKATMSCREIDIEMAKVQGVHQAIVDQDKFDGRSVLAFLGGFGLGNSMAKSSAEKGVAKRMAELQVMRVSRNCGLATTAAQPTN
ncbi:conserved exported protein of unknown function [Burkholderia multivorans]